MGIERKLRALLVVGAVSVATGCGQVQVDTAAEDAPDSGATAEVDGTQSSDQSETTVAPTDTVAEEIKVECETNFDCVLILTGKNPCNPPVCQAGKCVKSKKPAGSKCIDNSLTPAECEHTACDSQGICVVVAKKEGVSCGLGSCGHKCAIGLCVAATSGDYDDGNPCTADSCNQGIEVKHEPLTDLTAACDDNDACTAGDGCVQGKCKGQSAQCSDGVECTQDGCDAKAGCQFTAKDANCSDGDACTQDGCDPKFGCKIAGFSSGAKCDDGNSCTKDDACTDKGQCTGAATCACKVDTDCKQNNLCLGVPTCQADVCTHDAAQAVQCTGPTGSACLLNQCDAKTGQCGLVSVQDGKICDDANACSSVSTCEAGKCEGLFDVTCDDKNACTDDVCTAQSGCVFSASAATCDDGNACTTSDACANGGCTGAAKNCDDNVACTLDNCDGKSGACANNVTEGKCNDGNPCTSDVCDAKLGCTAKADEGSTCDDGDPCTQDKCSAGKCTGAPVCQCESDAGCNDNNPCTADTCAEGKCANTAAPLDNKPCNTGDKCQVANSGLCAAGTCKSGNQPIACKAVGACQTAACNPATGTCDVANKPDNQTCDADGNGCTQGDKCVSGKCTAGAAPNCASATTACGDGKCKSTGATTSVCETVAKAAGTACEDGNYCSADDKCDTAGKCTAGPPLSCAAVNDACNTGSCDETKNQCVKAPKATTVGCDDSLYCTTADHCDAVGKCVGGGVIVCAGGNCTVGACDEVAKKCGTKLATVGATCSDSSVCSANDSCDAAGVCKGGTATTCSDANPCTADSCDPAKGCVYTPIANAACDDGNACTGSDKCDALGKCQAGTFTCACKVDLDCNDANSCTTDKCALGKCTNSITSGAACDDKNPCSLASACNSTGSCAPDPAKPFDCTASSDACNTGTCYDNVGVAACKKLPKTVTTACDDGLYCTTGDLCDSAGKCIGGAPPLCGKVAVCNTVACTESAKGCLTTPSTKGTACTDSNPCTSGDACDGIGKCGAGSAVPDFTTCDDANADTSADFCLKQTCAGFEQFAGPKGPTTGVRFLPSLSAFVTTSLGVAGADHLSLGSWQATGYKLGTGVSTVADATPTATTAPLTALADQVMVGYAGQVHFLPAATTTWQMNVNGLATGVKAAYAKVVDWRAVDTKVLGGTLYVGLSGTHQGSAVGVAAQCTIDPPGKTTAVCKVTTLGTTYGPLAARIKTVQTCITCPVTPWLSTAIAPIGSVSALYTSLDGDEAPWGGAYTVLAGPVINPASALPFADLWRANLTPVAPVAGRSVRWVVGQSGHVSYEKFGTTGLTAATVTKFVQSQYSFRSVFQVGTFTLIFGNKPDAGNSANRLPVLLAHKEVAQTQSGTAYWTELTLGAPAFATQTCPNNGLVVSGMEAGPTDLLAYANVCDNTKLSSGVATRTSRMYRRGL